MPGFTPVRRWQPPYYPFKRDPFGTRVLGVSRTGYQRTNVRMPDVRELSVTGNCLYLPNGMPKG